MKIKLPRILILGLKIYCIFCAVLLTAALIFFIFLYTVNPKVTIINEATSPNAKWVATAKYLDYVSIWTPPSYTVTLEPSPSSFFNSKKMVVLEVENIYNQPPEIKWTDNNNLKIKFFSYNNGYENHTYLITQLKEYSGINISYTQIKPTP